VPNKQLVRSLLLPQPSLTLRRSVAPSTFTSAHPDTSIYRVGARHSLSVASHLVSPRYTPHLIGARITARSHRRSQQPSYQRLSSKTRRNVSRQSQARRRRRSPLPRRATQPLPAASALTPIHPPRLAHRNHPRIPASFGLVHRRPSTATPCYPRDSRTAARPCIRRTTACTRTAPTTITPLGALR
jgi:hypothetical protein